MIMKRFFVVLCFVLLAMDSSWAQTSVNEQLDALVEELAQMEGAESANVGPMMIKMARAAAKKDKDMPEEKRQLFINMKRMAIVEMSESPAATKSAFKIRMESFNLDGFTKAESANGVKAVAYYHISNGRVDFIVMALFEEKNTSLSIFEGDFEEAFARTFLLKNVKRQEPQN